MSYNLDSLSHNQDWTKALAWDLPTTTAECLAWARRGDVDLEEFKRLPVYEAHVDDPGLEWLRTL